MITFTIYSMLFQTNSMKICEIMVASLNLNCCIDLKAGLMFSVGTVEAVNYNHAMADNIYLAF